MKKILTIALAMITALTLNAQQRKTTLINNDWTFHLGNASSMLSDFTHGTEYFTYVTKIGSNNGNKGPASADFDDSSWQKVSLPHDWAVDLPFSENASHSHGYKCLGWQYPQNSIGWYRHRMNIPYSEYGKHFELRFDGIYRNSQVFFNGIYLGGEQSGYLSSVYDITPYIKFGEDNVIVVRADASLEEGWFYEGAGIYRDVWLIETSDLHVAQMGTKVLTNWGKVNITSKISNDDFRTGKSRTVAVNYKIEDPYGQIVASSDQKIIELRPLEQGTIETEMKVSVPFMWDFDARYMYKLHTYVWCGGSVVDEEVTSFGFRDLEYHNTRGFLLNNRRVEIVGVNLHQDAAGVGSAIPRELWRYRLQKLKDLGFNAVRCSHNPASPAMLDICDEIGLLVIDENRFGGASNEQLNNLQRMMERDINHPCIMLWSLGNEEWFLENDTRGFDTFRILSERAHVIDPTRKTVYANAGGAAILGSTDVIGYNYIAQNNVESDHFAHPDWFGIGTEETTGCGTRGATATVPSEGWMLSLNRRGVDADTRNSSDLAMRKTIAGKTLNVIGRSWNYYNSRKRLGGMFYWTGYDYRGEPNPMAWPATGSQFGLLDYCGFPKDEMFYLQAQLSKKAIVHICPPVDNEVWVYTNCNEVELYADGKKVGVKSVAEGDYAYWTIPEGTRKLTAKGYRDGAAATSDTYPEELPKAKVKASKTNMAADGQDIIVLDLSSYDQMQLSVSGPAEILGWGNGNPGFKEKEREYGAKSLLVKPFNGRAQVILRSLPGQRGFITVRISGIKDPIVLSAL